MFKRLNLKDIERLASESHEIKLTKERALEVIRMLLNSNKEHLLGLQMPYEKLRNKVADRVNSGEVKITNITKIETIKFLTTNFYNYQSKRLILEGWGLD